MSDWAPDYEHVGGDYSINHPFRDSAIASEITQPPDLRLQNIWQGNNESFWFEDHLDITVLARVKLGEGGGSVIQ
jgi:hypothetical protein